MRIISRESLDGIKPAAEAAAADGVTLCILSPPGAAGFWGPLYFREMIAAARSAVPRAQIRGALDAAGDAGYAQAAIRAGLDAVIFTGPEDVAARLADIAAQAGVELWTERPAARG